ncbi:MAG: substrate-binding domain-containing protein [Eubacterium sp.]|nr:substrate-binding domain-containing protein [Eubacterium sp.]
MIITTMLGMVLIATIVISVIFFRGRLKETKQLLVSSEYNAYDKYYVMITDNRNSDYWGSIYNGALEEAKKNNSYVKLMGDDLEDEFTKEDYLRMAINSKVDGIIVEGDDNRKTTGLLIDALNAGIPVVTVAEDNVDSGRKSFIGVNGYNLGKEYGEQVCHYVKEAHMTDCNAMVLLDNGQTSTSQSVILQAIKETIKNYSMDEIIKVEEKSVTSNTDFAAEEEIRDLFVSKEAFPDVIVCLSEKSTVCVYQTVVDYNKVGKVEIFGYYLSPTIESAIEKNIIKSSLVVNTEQMGQDSVRALEEYKESGYVSAIYLIDTTLITKDSLPTSEEEGGDEDDQEAE